MKKCNKKSGIHQASGSGKCKSLEAMQDNEQVRELLHISGDTIQPLEAPSAITSLWIHKIQKNSETQREALSKRGLHLIEKKYLSNLKKK